MRTGAVTPQRIKKFRDFQALSAFELGVALGYTRSYIKSLEGGSLPIRHKFATKFALLERRAYAAAAQTQQIQSIYPLPRQLKIMVKPHRCPHCREWFLFPSPAQRICTDPECRRKAKARR